MSAAVGYIKNVRDYLMQLGIGNNQVFFEYFGEVIKEEQNGYTEEGRSKSYKINLLKSGKELLWEPGKGSLL